MICIKVSIIMIVFLINPSTICLKQINLMMIWLIRLIIQYFLKLIHIMSDEEYIPPVSQPHQNKILIYNANGQVGNRLIQHFRNDHEIQVNPNIIIGTIDNQEKYANDLGLTIAIEIQHKQLLNSAILQSDIILFPLSTTNTQELQYLLKYLKCLTCPSPKKLIVISSVFYWRNRNGSPGWRKEEYLQRSALSSAVEELQHLALGLGSLNSSISSCVINCGLVYGMGQDVLFPLFKQALEQKHPLSIYGGGNNRIPSIHVDDLAQLTFDLAFANTSGFFYAVDHGSLTQEQLVTLISQTIGNGKIENLPIENGFLHQNFDILTADISIDPKSIPTITTWKYKEGFLKNIGSIVGQFNISRGLKPNKILIYGTPLSGKTKIAQILSKNYGLPVISIKRLIQQIKNEDSPFANQIKGVLEELKAVRVEEERKIYQDAKKKKKGKGVQDFDPSKVTVRLPDHEVSKVVKRRINMADCLNKGYIIDSVLKTHQQLQAVFLNQKGQTIEAILPNSIFNIEATQEQTKERVKKLPADVTEGTHWTQGDNARRFITYTKQNEGKKWHSFFSGKTDIKQVPMNYGEPASLIEFIERNGPLGFKVKEKKAPEEPKPVEPQGEPQKQAKHEQEGSQEQETDEFNLQKLTQSQVKILNEKSRPIRQYLIDNVIPQITEGLLQICKQTPPDPIKFLIHFLQNKRSKKRTQRK